MPGGRDALVRRLVELFNDHGDPESVAELYDPDVVWRPGVAGSLEGEGYAGHEGILRFWRDMDETWSQLTVELRETGDLPDGAWARIELSGNGRASGIEIRQELWAIFRLRDGRVLRAASYVEREEAFRAAATPL